MTKNTKTAAKPAAAPETSPAVVTIEVFSKVGVNKKTGEKFNRFFAKGKNGKFYTVRYTYKCAMRPQHPGTLTFVREDADYVVDKDTGYATLYVNNFISFKVWQPPEEAPETDEEAGGTDDNRKGDLPF